MIGGFENNAGDFNFWDLTKMQPIGKTEKSHCTIGVEFAPDGLTMFTSTIYERIKVDNFIKIF